MTVVGARLCVSNGSDVITGGFSVGSGLVAKESEKSKKIMLSGGGELSGGVYYILECHVPDWKEISLNIIQVSAK